MHQVLDFDVLGRFVQVRPALKGGGVAGFRVGAARDRARVVRGRGVVVDAGEDALAHQLQAGVQRHEARAVNLTQGPRPQHGDALGNQRVARVRAFAGFLVHARQLQGVAQQHYFHALRGRAGGVVFLGGSQQAHGLVGAQGGHLVNDDEALLHRVAATQQPDDFVGFDGGGGKALGRADDRAQPRPLGGVGSRYQHVEVAAHEPRRQGQQRLHEVGLARTGLAGDVEHRARRRNDGAGGRLAGRNGGQLRRLGNQVGQGQAIGREERHGCLQHVLLLQTQLVGFGGRRRAIGARAALVDEHLLAGGDDVPAPGTEQLAQVGEGRLLRTVLGVGELLEHPLHGLPRLQGRGQPAIQHGQGQLGVGPQHRAQGLLRYVEVGHRGGARVELGEHLGQGRAREVPHLVQLRRGRRQGRGFQQLAQALVVGQQHQLLLLVVVAVAVRAQRVVHTQQDAGLGVQPVVDSAQLTRRAFGQLLQAHRAGLDGQRPRGVEQRHHALPEQHQSVVAQGRLLQVGDDRALEAGKVALRLGVRASGLGHQGVQGVFQLVRNAEAAGEVVNLGLFVGV